MQYKAILFDLGNTLIHFTGTWQQVFSKSDKRLTEYLIKMGLAIDPVTFPVKFRQKINRYHTQREIDFVEHSTMKTLINILSEFGFHDVPQSELTIALEKMYIESQKYWLPEINAASVFATLKKQGYRLGIISNASNDADVQLLVNKTNIRHHLDFVLSSAYFGIRKPSPIIFNKAFSYWPDIEPSNIVMIGDTLNADILGANNIGIKSVWLTKRINSSEMKNKDSHILPDETINDLEDIPNLMNSLN